MVNILFTKRGEMPNYLIEVNLMKNEKLIEKVNESGYKRDFIAAKLGLSPYGLTKKLRGQNEFKVSEAKSIMKILNISKEEAFDIFLS